MRDLMLMVALIGGIKAIIPTPGHLGELNELVIAGIIASIMYLGYRVQAINGKRKKAATQSDKDQASADRPTGSAREATC